MKNNKTFSKKDFDKLSDSLPDNVNIIVFTDDSFMYDDVKEQPNESNYYKNIVYMDTIKKLKNPDYCNKIVDDVMEDYPNGVEDIYLEMEKYFKEE